MKIALLSAASSVHTIQWVNRLSSEGVEVHLISQHPLAEQDHPAANIHLFPYRGALGYFSMVPAVKRLLKAIQPDLVNAHYASGYATTAKLAGYHPWLLSVWGSDVYDFPDISSVHKLWLSSNLRAADAIASTSHCMAVRTRSLVPGLNDVSITPFGVDTGSFASAVAHSEDRQVADGDLVIGTIKTMADKYGIDTLIRSFSLLRNRVQKTDPELARRLRLRLVGGGDQISYLKELARKQGVSDVTVFRGHVSHGDVPGELAKLDIYVALSRIESFGVAVIEAGAAARPVVVSDVGGLPEVVVDGETGLVVPCDNPSAAADALEILVLDAGLRWKMGQAGQRHVREMYDWSVCVRQMIHVYANTIASSNRRTSKIGY